MWTIEVRWMRSAEWDRFRLALPSDATERAERTWREVCSRMHTSGGALAGARLLYNGVEVSRVDARSGRAAARATCGSLAVCA